MRMCRPVVRRVFATNRVGLIERAEDVCTDSHEHQGDGGWPGADRERSVFLLTEARGATQVRGNNKAGAVKVRNLEIGAASDEPALKMLSRGVSEGGNSDPGGTAAAFLREQLRIVRSEY